MGQTNSLTLTKAKLTCGKQKRGTKRHHLNNTITIHISNAPFHISSAMEFAVDSGSIKNADDQCLAARGEYMPPAAGVAGLQIWAKPLGAGKTAVLFINGGGSPYSASISLKALNITTASVRAPLGPTAALAPGGSFPFLQASCHSDCAISLIVCRSLRLLAGLS